MKSIQTLIGDEFEREFSRRFPGFENSTLNERVPDFYNPDYQFWVETKAGNKEWGPRIKKYQIDRFRELDQPTVYALGFHKFDDALKRLNRKSEEKQRKMLEEEMFFDYIFFVNANLIASIWNKDAKVSSTTKEEYLMLKPSVINNIILNRKFERKRREISSAQTYYGFRKRDLVIIDPRGSNESPVGTILHRRNDAPVLDYLRSQRII